MGKLLLCFILLFISDCYGYSSPTLKKYFFPGVTSAPLPTTCMTAAFTESGGPWYSISLQLTNNCGTNVDMQSTTVTFLNGKSLNTSFWGSFGVITYPDNTLTITSQAQGSSYLASLYFHIPEQPWANSILPAGQSITLKYGASSNSYDPKSVNVYLSGAPAQTGQIGLTNATSQPANVAQPYALVGLLFNGQMINTVQVPWSGALQVPNLTPGTYTLQPQSITDSQGNTYQGAATPSSVTVTANQTVTATINYTEIVKYGSINIQAGALPSAISGYTGSPSVTLTRSDTGAALVQSVPWGATTAVSSLANGVTYQLTAASITYNGYNCTGTFMPASVASSATNPPTAQLTYNCVAHAQDQVPVSVSGLPSSVTSITATFQPSTGGSAVTQTIPISSGSGSASVMLADGVVYSVSSSAVTGYSALFNPQPLTATQGATETISYSQAAQFWQHPGVLLNQAQLDFIKQQVTAKVQPYYQEFLNAQNSQFGNKAYQVSGPYAGGVNQCGSFSSPDNGCSAADMDTGVAYVQALLWYITEDPTYASNAIKIMNNYAYNLKGFAGFTPGYPCPGATKTCSNAPLQAAWDSEKWPRVAEIIRYGHGGSAGWAANDIAAFSNMLKNVYEPLIYNGSASNGNWELSMIEGMMGIAVFNEDAALLSHAQLFWSQRIPAYFYNYELDNPLYPNSHAPAPRGTPTWNGQAIFSASTTGVSQETCRDLKHTEDGISAAINAAETDYLQGGNLYTANNAAIRLITSLNLMAGLESSGSTTAPTDFCTQASGKLTLGNGFTYVIAYNEYHNRLHNSNMADASGTSGTTGTANTYNWINNKLLAITSPADVGNHMTFFEPLTHYGNAS
jgi:hypothetical protein